MSKALLDKARAILAHPKQVPSPKLKPLEDEDPKTLMIEMAVPTPSPKGMEIEPAPPNPKAIYWETGDGRILGPALPEFLGRDGNTFWISTTFDGQIRWINADRLRSRQAFETQVVLREVEIIREDHR
ncbi:MAG: hypothetical protein OEY86_20070 [Nitrospira sp.]|nr:hypothetical protein [Nitrospira sp.]